MNKTSNNLQYLKIILFALMTVTIAFSNVYAQQELSPLKQFKSGVMIQDIKCNESFVLIVKVADGYPACVKPTSVSRLSAHGWITIEKFETIHPILQQNQTGIYFPRNINTTSLINSTTKNATNEPIHILGSINTSNSVQNQSMLNYSDCTSYFPIFLDNSSSEIYPHSVKPLPPVTVNLTVTSTEADKIKILEIGMCPTQLKVGDKPHFTLTYQNISNKQLSHYDIHPYSHLLVYTISPPDKVEEHIFSGGPAVGLAQFVGLILPNQIVIDPAKGAGMLNGDIKTILFGPSGEYQITNSGLLTVTMYLGLIDEPHDLVDTIQFNVNATQ
jgi:hypothetical protein